jgi:protein-disulfide isomerase-like protein with CxxC motif
LLKADPSFHRDKVRTWCALFIQDRSLAATSGKPFMIHDFPDFTAMRQWLEHPYATHGDRMIVGYLELRRIERDAREQVRSVQRAYMVEGVRVGTSAVLKQWLREWLTPELAAAGRSWLRD